MTSLTVRDARGVYKREVMPHLARAVAEKRTFHMRMHILPALAATPIEDINSRVLKRTIDDMLRAGTHPQSVRCAMAALRSVTKMLVADHVLKSNPVPVQGGWIRVPDVQPKSLTKKQLQEFLTAAMDEPDFPLILFLAWTGTRIGEAMALRWSEVDLTPPSHAKIVRSVRLNREAPPKTRFGRRSVGLIPPLVENMMALRSRLQGPDALVYQQGNGGYVNARHLHHVCARVAKRAGLPPVHPHMLRHTWATLMLNSGLPMHFVSRNLGHHSTAFTAALYATAQPDPHLEEMDRVAQLTMFQGGLTEASGDHAGAVGDEEAREGRLLDFHPRADADAAQLAAADQPVDGRAVDPEALGDFSREE